MPKIEREIPYTFSAYSGGAMKSLDGTPGGGRLAGGSRKRDAGARKKSGEAATGGAGGVCSNDNSQATEGKDVYRFEDDDEDEDKDNEGAGPLSRKRPKAAAATTASTSEVKDPAEAAAEVSEPDPGREEEPFASQGRVSTTSLLDGRSDAGEKAGLLVMAALTAAENDIMGDKKKESKESDVDADGKEEVKKDAEKSEAIAPATLSHSARSLVAEKPPTASSKLPPSTEPKPDKIPCYSPVSSTSPQNPTVAPSASAPPQPPPHTASNSPYISPFVAAAAAAGEPYNLYSSALDIASGRGAFPTAAQTSAAGYSSHPHAGFRSDYPPPPPPGYPPLPPPTGPRSSSLPDYPPPSDPASSSASSRDQPLPPLPPMPNPFDTSHNPYALPPAGKDPYSTTAADQYSYGTDRDGVPAYHYSPQPAYPPHPPPPPPPPPAPSGTRLPPPTSPHYPSPTGGSGRLPSLSGTHGNPYHPHYRYF